MPSLAWGKRVSPEFRSRVLEIACKLSFDPNHLMACMAFESGRTFSPSVKNGAGSGATGLIQFMPSTARLLGTTTTALAAMTAVDQLEYVSRYFEPFRGRLKTIEDFYMAILWPRGVGKPDSYPLFRKDDAKAPKLYIQNRGLDYNKDGVITKAEAAKHPREMLDLGSKPENRYDWTD